MAGDLATQSGGVHPGKPIIWPSGKGSTQAQSVDQAQTSQTAGNVRGSVSTGGPISTSAPGTVTQAQGTTTALPPSQAFRYKTASFAARNSGHRFQRKTCLINVAGRSGTFTGESC